jgi:hypothetical protein
MRLTGARIPSEALAADDVGTQGPASADKRTIALDGSATLREVNHKIADAEKALSPSQIPDVPTYKP